VDVRFTAGMEKELDEIAEGSAEWLPYLRDFFRGPDGLEETVKRGEGGIDPREASTVRLEGLEARVRIGRFGPFVESGDGDAPVTASIPDGIAPADLSAETVEELVRSKREGPDRLGEDPATGKPILLLQGRFGPYVQLGEAEDDGPKPKRASLPKGVTPDGMDLETALRLLSLPRDLGPHPESGKPVEAGIGRFGPFVVHDGDFRSLAKEDDVYTVGFGRALELLAQPKGGRRARSAVEPLREVGPHPADGEPVRVFEGRYGPYVKHGAVNASLPKDLGPDEVTMDQAVELLAARAARGGTKTKGGARGRTAAKKPAAKKPAGTSTAKKPATKKTAAKKPAGRKPAGGK
jgi:DNA topoisomerase I